jgi:hypothetical protein
MMEDAASSYGTESRDLGIPSLCPSAVPEPDVPDHHEHKLVSQLPRGRIFRWQPINDRDFCIQPDLASLSLTRFIKVVHFDLASHPKQQESPLHSMHLDDDFLKESACRT